MKKTISIFCALMLLLALSWLAAHAALRTYVADMVVLYGSDYTSHEVSVQGVSVEFRHRQLILHDVCLENDARYVWADLRLFCAKKVSILYGKSGVADMHFLSLLPQLISISSIDISGATVFYDADSGGANLVELRQALLDAAANAIKDRLNAAASNKSMWRLFHVGSINVSDIKVQARSKINTARSRDFSMKAISVPTQGATNSGVAAAEIIARIAQDVAGQVQLEAIGQGFGEVARPASTRREVRNQSSERAEEKEEGLSGAIRSVGREAGATSKRIWQRTKSIFD